jgi:hypothetical protein
MTQLVHLDSILIKLNPLEIRLGLNDNQENRVSNFELVGGIEFTLNKVEEYYDLTVRGKVEIAHLLTQLKALKDNGTI